jgi:hypothetical protein
MMNPEQYSPTDPDVNDSPEERASKMQPITGNLQIILVLATRVIKELMIIPHKVV